MKNVEITYRFEDHEGPVRGRPADATAAQRRMDDGSRALADLFASAGGQTGPARRVIPIDPRDLGLLQSDPKAPRQRPYAAVLGCSDARVTLELIVWQGRGEDNRVVNVPRTGAEGVGDVVDVRIVRAAPHSLIGEAVVDLVPRRLPLLSPA